MGFATDNFKTHLVGSRCGIHQPIDTRGVKSDATPGSNLAAIEMLNAKQAHLFAHGDNQLQRTMRNILFAHHFQRLDNLGDAGLVVGAENSFPGAGKDTILQHRLHPFGRTNGIHMHRDQQRFTVFAVGRKGRDQIAALATDFLPSIIHHHRCAELL